VLGEKPLEWVKAQNDLCLKTVGDPRLTPQYARILAIYDSKDKIPGLTRTGTEYYK